MNIVLTVCGVVSLIGLVVQAQNGGWKVILLMLLWFAVLFGLAAQLSSGIARAAVLLTALGGALAIRSSARRHTSGTAA